MRIGVDLDGVIYDYPAGLRGFMGVTIDTHPEPTAWDFWDQWGMTEEQFWATCAAAVNAGYFFAEGGVADGAIHWMHRLRTAGHTLHLVTARSSGRPASPALPSAAEINTRHWLRVNSVPFDTLTFVHDKTSVPTDVFIEDNLRNYDDLEAAGVRAYLVDQPYNQIEGCGRRRVASFAEFGQLLLTPVPA